MFKLTFSGEELTPVLNLPMSEQLRRLLRDKKDKIVFVSSGQAPLLD